MDSSVRGGLQKAIATGRRGKRAWAATILTAGSGIPGRTDMVRPLLVRSCEPWKNGMPFQNRVNPYGTIFRSPARGTFMGNRGVLHTEKREIVRQFKGRRWITCCLEFRGRKRSVMSPGRYTELFFLDEAVAFAAGHRPCAECRWERFIAFQHAWKRRDEAHSKTPASAPQIDTELHRSRVDRHGRKVTYEANLNSLPNGCFVQIDGSAFLVWNEALLLWTPERYARKHHRKRGLTVTVLTPQPIVQCFAQGYEPGVHISGHAL